MIAVSGRCSASPRDTPWIPRRCAVPAPLRTCRHVPCASARRSATHPWRLAFGFPCLMTVPGNASSHQIPLYLSSARERPVLHPYASRGHRTATRSGAARTGMDAAARSKSDRSSRDPTIALPMGLAWVCLTRAKSAIEMSSRRPRRRGVGVLSRTVSRHDAESEPAGTHSRRVRGGSSGSAAGRAPVLSEPVITQTRWRTGR
jgi:hypothetical protein